MSFLADLFTKLVNLPHDLWKHTNENSGVGASEFEQETENFWGKISLIGSLIIGTAYVIWKYVF